ncbi:MAG TPA: nuclear transport factor 2 family protein [Alphaproteobacteria bacterium]|nr:nuclear transport factor 2 family protein [Alphaproteobacteria bacterium]
MDEDWAAAAVNVQRAWKDAFEARDLDKLCALYAEETAFYGSTADFYTTPAGVRAYFEKLPSSFSRSDYRIPHIVTLSPDAMAATGEVIFYTEQDGIVEPHPFRMTHVLVRKDGQWKIATHHASPQPV